MISFRSRSSFVRKHNDEVLLPLGGAFKPAVPTIYWPGNIRELENPRSPADRLARSGRANACPCTDREGEE
jgi:hypothetical protein